MISDYNSQALKLAGIGRSTQDPSFGNIFRDDNGDPTGLLIEHGQFPLFKLAMKLKQE